VVATLSPFLLSFPSLRKLKDEKKREEEILPRFKITAHSEKHSFFEGQLFFRQFSSRNDRDISRRFNTRGVTKLRVSTSFMAGFVTASP